MAILVGFFFIGTLLFVHYSTRAAPLPVARPLDIDEVPFPVAGQASTVFSLTALFGAYYGMLVIFGVWALAGLVAGTILALICIRQVTLHATEVRYEDFLVSRLARFSDSLPIVPPFAAIQLLFAVSELLVLRRILAASFGVVPVHATLMATFVAIIGYTYSVTGGYNAIFRTDIVQLVFVLVMCGVLLSQFITDRTVIDVAAVTQRLHGLHTGHWFGGSIPSGWMQHAFDFVVAFPMGMTFLLSSPDTWKRVFIVSRRNRSWRAVLYLVAAGALPFLLILPLAFIARPIGSGTIDPLFILQDIGRSRIVMAFTLLGMLSSFLSAFNSAFISAVHLPLLQARRWRPVGSEIHRFRYLAGGTFIVIMFVFAAGINLGNPYAIGNFLLAPYALAGAITLGLCGARRTIKTKWVLWTWAIGLVWWVLFLVPYGTMWSTPSTKEANTIPPAMAAFCVVALVIYLASKDTEWTS
jgi:hypothetical protein